ncbi:JmjC-domain-containing protein, partial [Testicularia cyperi]
MSADILPPTAVESQVTALDNSTASTSSAPATSPKSTTSPRAPSAASPLLTKLRQQPSRHARHDQLTTGSSPATINASSPSHHNSESSRHSTPATSTGGDSIEQPHTQQTDAQSAPSSERPTQDNESAAHVSQAPPLPESTPSQALPNANAEHPLASIKPAYFYPLDANSSGQDGVPVFEPTMEQFRDFYAFCQAIDSWGMQSGIVKVIPPKEWRDALPDLRPAMPDSRTDTQPPATPEQDEPADISKVRIRNAIAQHFTLAGSGVWRQTNITRTVKIWNAKQWAETCVSEGQKGPEMDRMKWKVEVDGVSNNGWGPKSIGGKDEPHSAILEEDGVRTRSGKARPLLAPNDVRAGTKRKRGAAEHQDKRQSAEPSSARPSTPQPQTGTQTRSQSQPRSPPSQTQQRSPMTRSREAKEAATAAAAAGTVSTPEGSPAKAKKNWAAEATTFEEWRNFDYRNTWLREGLSHEQIAKFDQESGDAQTVDGAADPNAASSSSDAHGDGEKNTNQQQAVQLPSPTDWNEETCREIESEYWRSLNFGKPPMYGADLKGTLFDHRTKDWNVGHLDNLLTRLRLKRKLPGVNTPYLYWGMWKATFAWHVEDMDLYSINYIHFGAPKQWYSIRQADRQRFESAMAGAFPSDSRRCPHFMRHKSYLASPSFLASHGIRPLKLVHHAGEFVITYPYGYHSGFNLGFNCAESVNFALDSWLDIGRKANYCHCDQSQNSVHIDVDAMLEESKEMEELERKREVRRAKDESVKAIEEEELERRRIRNEKARERRKLKREQEATGTMTGGGGMAAGGAVSLLFQGGDDFYIDPKSASTSPCVFCPANVAADLVATPATIPTANPKLKAMAGRHAHRLCASFVPETWVGKQGKTEVVSGIEGIDKARFSLKCQICPDANLQKLYPKIQCTRGKCARSAHVSCALVETHGWFIDVCPIDVADRLEAKKGPATSMAAPDGAEPDVPADDGEDEGGERLVVLCRTHNPLFREAEEARRAEELRDRISSLPLPSTIRIKTSGGMFEALMVDVHEDEDEVVIEDQGRPSTVKFHQIILAEAKVESP